MEIYTLLPPTNIPPPPPPPLHQQLQPPTHHPDLVVSEEVDDDIEEVEVDRPPLGPLRRADSHTTDSWKGRSMRPPIRRRIHIEKNTQSSSRMQDFHRHLFEITTTTTATAMLDSRRSMDGSDISCSSNLTMATSATSSGTDPWSSSGGFVEEGEGEDAGDFNWDNEDRSPDADRDCDGEGEVEEVVPKLEPIDDVDIMDLSPASDVNVKDSLVPETPSSVSACTTPAMVKRPRGRPRKHPKPTAESLAKVAKGRSKTGCITCRKRKKKCDETKPGCMNCEKNSVKCEGYPEKTIWKSGKEKAEEARMRRASSITLSSIQLPFLVHGLETEGDRIFLHHYISRLSVIFTVEGERDSAFRSILLPMAQQHAGLMHSILALSSKHIDYKSDYGVKILLDHPKVDVETLEKRSQFHQDEAFKELTSSRTDSKATPATYAQMICLILQTLSDPSPNGQHRFHLQHYQKLIKESPPDDGESMRFIHEFFQYHIHADELIALPKSEVLYITNSDDWNLPSTVLQPSAVRLLGVFDGLFLYMSKITNIRNKIRQNIENGIDPIVDYKAFYAAAEIDAGIREWTAVWPAGDHRDAAGMLYRQMMWIYLWRTIYPPQTTNWKLDPHITTAVRDGVKLLSQFGPRDPSQTLLLAPAFVIGCAAFEVEMREPIRKAIAGVKSYMEYRNTDTALEVLEEVWRLMDERDERSWDWQSIAHRMGMDFLAT